MSNVLNEPTAQWDHLFKEHNQGFSFKSAIELLFTALNQCKNLSNTVHFECNIFVDVHFYFVAVKLTNIKNNRKKNISKSFILLFFFHICIIFHDTEMIKNSINIIIVNKVDFIDLMVPT